MHPPQALTAQDAYLPCSPRDVELVARVLAAGAPDARHQGVAARALHAVGGLRGLARSGRARLRERGALRAEEADALLAALDLARALHDARSERAKAPRLRSPEAIAAWAGARLAHLEHEEIWALSLNAQCTLIGARCIAQGGLSTVALSLPKLLRDVVSEGGHSFALVHNHPSGNPTASPEDIAVTRRVAEAAAVLEVPLLDHVIVAGRAWSCVPFGLGPGMRVA